MKKFCIVVDIFISIVIKNYGCDIKSKKSWYVLMLIVIGKCKNKIKKIHFLAHALLCHVQTLAKRWQCHIYK
jgi:hypothetical protein